MRWMIFKVNDFSRGEERGNQDQALKKRHKIILVNIAGVLFSLAIAKAKWVP
jgi:hypothetical protein